MNAKPVAVRRRVCDRFRKETEVMGDGDYGISVSPSRHDCHLQSGVLSYAARYNFERATAMLSRFARLSL
jgi:hypothetical protein